MLVEDMYEGEGSVLVLVTARNRCASNGKDPLNAPEKRMDLDSESTAMNDDEPTGG